MTARLVQVTNVSTSVTKDQLKSLFIHLGKIEEIQLYTESELISQTYNAKVGYIRFANSETAQAALNLTSTVFLDRPILCSLVQYPHKSSSSANLRIPEEHEAIKFCPLFNPNISLIPNGITWPNSIINRIVNTQVPSTSSKPASYIETIDPVIAERSLPPYPNLPGNTDQQIAEEIRRTVYVSELDPRVTLLNLYDLFSQVGETRYIKMTRLSANGIDYENLGINNLSGPVNIDLSKDSVGAYIEFSEQPSVIRALCLNGLNFAQRTIRVNHSTKSISIVSTKQTFQLDELRKETDKLEQQHKHSSSRSSHYNTSSSSSRRRRSRDRSTSRHKSSKTHSSSKSNNHHHSSSSKTKSSKSSSNKRDGSSGSTPTTQSDDDQEEHNNNQIISDNINNEDENVENMSTSSSKSRPSSPPPKPPRKQARRSKSRSRSKSKHRTSSSTRQRHKSSTLTSTSSFNKHRSSRSPRDRDRHKTSSSSSRKDKEKDSSPHYKSSNSKKDLMDELIKPKKRSHSKSRKRSKSRDRSERKRSKSNDSSKRRTSKENKSSKSDRKRSKSRDRHHHHHRHKSSSSKHDDKKSKSKSESKHKSSSSLASVTDAVCQVNDQKPRVTEVKQRDYDQEEREAMETNTDIEEQQQQVKHNGNNNNNNDNNSNDSSTSSNTMEN